MKKRFLATENLRPGIHVRLSPEESKHCTRVMRLGPGDNILLTDGRGAEAEGKILSAEKDGVVAEITALREAAERSFRFELIQAPLKGPRMDWLIEKATELGVDAIHVLDSQHAVAGGERAERWQRLAQAAMKQSGNPRMPEIHGGAGFAEVLTRIPSSFSGFLLSPGATQGLAGAVENAVKRGRSTIVLAIGPEGGFSAEEEAAFLQRGFVPCLLSRQILRGETAALSALAIALHALEIGTSSGL